MRKELKFKAIPGASGGIICLGIDSHDDGYMHVFVGGCGVGRAKTVPAAKKMLLDRAKATCERHIKASLRIARHYRGELRRLNREGLVRSKTGE